MHVSSNPYFSQSSNDSIFLQFQHLSVTWFSFGVSVPYESVEVVPVVDPVDPYVDPVDPVEPVDPMEPVLPYVEPVEPEFDLKSLIFSNWAATYP